MKSSTLILLLFTFLGAYSQQDWGCEKPNKKALKEYEKAHQLHFKGSAAYQYLVDAVKLDPTYAEALSVLAYINEKKDQSDPQNYKRTVAYHEKTREACPAYRNYESSFFLAKAYYKERRLVQAQLILDEYLAKAKNTTAEYKEAEALKDKIEAFKAIFAKPVPFDPKMVQGASTEFDEYLPMLSPDNQYLFFTRKAEVDSKSVYGVQEKELFIQSRKQYNGKYSEGIPMPTPFNQGSYQGGSSISVDNRLLFITIVTQSATRDGRLFSNGDIFYSEFKGGSWSELKSIGDHINGKFTWEGQPSISADNKTLYYASARGEDNYGGMDIYKSIRQEDGSWGPPINLGPTINTSGSEKSPFMHSDSHTLYFSSDGHPGVGGQDIFLAKLNKFGTFDQAINLGVPINTDKDEHGFMVSTDGNYGYFASNIEKEGLDIYYFELPESAKPKEVIFLKGSISSKNAEAAKGMNIELKNTATNEVISGVVDEENGEYVAVISAEEGQDVMMMAKKNGYAFTSQYINTKQDVVGKPLKTPEVTFNPIETGETYQINNINFDTDSYELNDQVVNILNEFIVFLQENPGVKISINGHTDNVGDPQSNLILSENRARAVKNYLVLEGISKSRLEFHGYGESSPIASNNTTEGRAKNRRTEFVILAQ